MLKIPLAKKKRFSGLEIEAGFVKFAQAEDFAKGRRIVKLIVKKLPSQSEKDIVAALRNIKDEVKGKTEHLILTIAHHKVTVRFLRFPTLDVKEIEGMVRLQSTKELPFPKEEIISDYLITERTQSGYTKVALVIVHQDVINGYLGILKKANLEPERITFSTQAVLNWYRLGMGRERSKGGSILIDLDADNTDIAIFYNSYLDFTRGLTFGTAQLRAYADLKNKLAQEIKRTIEGYGRQEKTRKAQRFLLGEAAKEVEGLKSFLEQEFNLPCEMVAPLRNLTCQKEVSSVRYNPELSLLRVLGAALEANQKGLNLLPFALRQRQEIKLRRKMVWKISILFLGIILLGSTIFAKKIHDKQLHISYLDKEIKRTQPLAADVENMLKKIELIETRGKIKGSSIDVLRQLHKLSPEDISLSTFNYDEENKKATLQGTSINRAEIFEFINILEKSAYFKNVQLKYASEKRAKAADYINFKIECILEQ